MKLKIIIFSACLLTAFCACKKFNNSFDSLLNNPSAPTPAAADVDLYLNNLELSLGTADPITITGNFYSGYDAVANIQGVSDFAAQLTRMEALVSGNTYFNAFTPGSFDNMWLTAYTAIFKTANTMIPLAEEKGQYVHAGIAKVMKAYTMITLVDVFGDIPYSEANQGVTIPNPKLDKGADVYAAALALLDSAIIELALPVSSTAKPTNDIFYNGDAASWITLA